MNLITDKWINIITKNEDVENISIFEFFQNSEEYVDISGPWPLRFAIYNLLFTIAQSALRGIIVDERSQRRLFSENYTQYVLEYLKQEEIQKCFNFYSKDFFYNFNIIKNEDIKKSYKNSWKKISIDKFSYGNNHNVWESKNIEDIRLTDEQKIYNLLTYMLFDPGKGNNYPKSYREDKLGFSPYGKNEIITYLRGSNCYETIWLNMIDEKSMLTNNSGNCTGLITGQPLWEKKPSSNGDKESLLNSQTTSIGMRMVLHSFFSYDEYSNEIYYDLVENNGYDKEPYLNFQYPYKTSTKIGENGIRYLECMENKHFMRDFPLVLSSNDFKYSTPVISNIDIAFEIYNDNKKNFSDIRVVCGGWKGTQNTSYFTRSGFSEFEAKLSLKKSQIGGDYSTKFARRYKECLEKIDNFTFTKIKKKCLNKKYQGIFHFGKKKQKLFDNIFIENLIQNLWYEIDNEYSFLISICHTEEVHFNKSKKEWNIKILKIWNRLIKEQLISSNINNRIKTIALKQIGENMIFKKVKRKVNN